MMLSDLGCFKQDYDLRLVLLAAFICVMASFTTVNLLSRAQQTDGGRKFVWLAVAAAIFGSGVWALHFVAMLAFMPTMPIYYDVHNSARSIVSAIVGAALAFAALECGARRKSGAIAGAVLLTAGVTAMHYDGVAGRNFRRSGTRIRSAGIYAGFRP
jgi:NO-binding membrane sensor protein with MHYT domain